MKEVFENLAEEAMVHVPGSTGLHTRAFSLEKFAELIVKKTLDEVALRAYVCGDRAWSDDVDRQWVELEFGLGKLAELKNDLD